MLMPSLPLDSRILSVPKAGADASEYEDAAAVRTDEWPVRAAVADGATESIFARAWAERLARGLVEQDMTTAAALRDGISDWRAEWRAEAQVRAERQPWYVAAKASEGAFAALLTLTLHPDGRWRAVSVGDCCLFLVRDGQLVKSWPFETPGAFANRPALVSSRSDQAVPAPETAAGRWQLQDAFLLATDALAAWLLGGGTLGEDGPVIDPSVAVDWNQDEFQSIVETARSQGALRNDDATLLTLHVEDVTDVDEDASTDP